ncbi:MAG: ribonuclease P [Nanoarchaeota archaeon]|nr:ribonuclease P [Nanoarchaeota archaeon]
MSQEKKIAVERMEILFELAKQTVKKDEEQAKKYVKIIKKINTKTKTRIPPKIKHFLCKKCDSVLIPGYNATVRMKQGRKITRCKECKEIKRQPYTREKKLKKDKKRVTQHK